MTKKNLTINDLADLMQKGFAKAEKDTDKKIDDLAIMVQKGFTEAKEDINKRFEQVDKCFDGIDNRLDGMVTKAEMNRRFDGLEDRVLASHQKRIEKLEAEVKELREIIAV